MLKWLGAVTVALSAAVAHAQPSPPPLEAYGKLPAIESVAVSPDGRRLALILSNGKDRLVTVMDAVTKVREVTLPAGDKKVVGLHWAGPNHVIFDVQHDTDALRILVREYSLTSAFDLDVEKRIIHPLVDTRKFVNTGAFGAVFGKVMTREVDGNPLLFFSGLTLGDGGSATLFRYEPEAGAGAPYRVGPLHTSNWLVATDGQPLARAVQDEENHRWTLQTRTGDSWASINAPVDVESPTLAGFGRRADTVLVYLPADDQRPSGQLMEVAPGQTAFGPPVVEADIEETMYDQATEVLTGYEQIVGDDRRFTFFDPKDARIWKRIERAYPGSIVRPMSVSADHARWVVYVDSPTEGPAFALVDLATGKASWIGGNYEAASKDLAPKMAIAFKASDGLQLTGYVTAPKGARATALPLAVLVHGGPADRDLPGFDWLAQAIASRGYAVLQVNYRGSSGFGRAFQRAGFGEVGRRMQTDLSDGVAYLASRGTIDPKRVCIVGSDYGGFAALAGAALQKGVYRCAADVAGFSDPRKLVGTAVDRERSRYRRFWWRYMGGEGDRKALMDAISPIEHASDVSIPVLLIHGKDDTAVDFSQSQHMFDALKKAGKDAQLVVLNHEDHWLLTGAGRLQMLQATIDFLEKNNPPG